MSDPLHKNPDWLKDRLLNAIKRFNASDDQFLLKDELTDDGTTDGSVGERAIAHRLAVHIEDEFRAQGYPNEAAKIAVDCEYNRHRGATKSFLVKEKLRERVEAAKKKALKEHPTKKGWYVFSIYPDIIVHRRGDDECNLIAVELKCASNTTDDPLDNLKLELFTKQNIEKGYKYVLGASVIAYDANKFSTRRLELGHFHTDPTMSA